MNRFAATPDARPSRRASSLGNPRRITIRLRIPRSGPRRADRASNASRESLQPETALAAELRGIEGCQLTAHLLIPGFTYTGMVARALPERPASAWTSEQVANRLLEQMGRGDFYVLCPDNEVTEQLDHARIQWNLNDIVENRPALSRWHQEFKEEFERFIAGHAGKT